MNKKGLSDVVTTVLIILISVAAVSAVWVLIKPLIEETGDVIPAQLTCTDNVIELKSCQFTNETEPGYNLVYQRLSSDSNLTNITIFLLSNGGNIFTQNQNNIAPIGQLGYIRAVTNQKFSEAYLSAIYSSIEGKNMACATQRVFCQDLTSSGILIVNGTGSGGSGGSGNGNEGNQTSLCVGGVRNGILEDEEPCDPSSSGTVFSCEATFFGYIGNYTCSNLCELDFSCVENTNI